MEELPPLTQYEQQFVESYVIDTIGARAIRRLKPHVRDGSAATEAYQLLRKAHVRAAVDAKLRERGHKFEMTAADVVAAWVKLVRADPRSIARMRRGACRRCYGLDHHYQWKDVNEWAAAIAAQAKEDPEASPPSAEGGFGYVANLSPHAKCPSCLGEGRLEMFVADSHEVPEADACLIAGYKQTKNGVEVIYRNQDAALLNLAKYLGVVTNDVNVRGGLKVESTVALSDEQRAVLNAALDKLL